MNEDLKITDFAHEFEEGGVEAVVMFATNESLHGETGPVIISTIEPERVVVALNELIFQARVDGLVARFTRERPDVDPAVIRRAATHYLLDAMVGVSRLKVSKYAETLHPARAKK